MVPTAHVPDIVQQGSLPDVATVAQRLVTEASLRGACENVTVMCLDFRYEWGACCFVCSPPPPTHTHVSSHINGTSRACRRFFTKARSLPAAFSLLTCRLHTVWASTPLGAGGSGGGGDAHSSLLFKSPPFGARAGASAAANAAAALAASTLATATSPGGPTASAAASVVAAAASAVVASSGGQSEAAAPTVASHATVTPAVGRPLAIAAADAEATASHGGVLAVTGW